MKIGFVLDDSLDVPDGVQQYVLILGDWLAHHGHQVRYLVGSTKRTDISGLYSLSKNVSVRFNGNRLKIPLPANKNNIKQILEQEQFDVLHVQMPFNPMLAGRVLSLAHKKTVIIGTFHIMPNSHMVSVGGRILGLWTKKTIKKFDGIVSVSKVAQDFAKNAFGVTSQVVPNTLDINKFRSDVKQIKHSTTINIVFLGRLVPRKGCEHLIRTMVELVPKITLINKNIHLTIYGKGEQDKYLKSLVKKLGLSGSVSFAGFVSEQDKPTVLGNADIIVYPSTGGESFGLVLVEGMASGSLVLAGNNPGYASVLGSLPDSLFAPTNYRELTEKIYLYSTDNSKKSSLIAKQQALVHQFDTDVVGSKIVSLYKKAIAIKDKSTHN